jgi:Na+/melibiose symporter-like transporter
MASLMIDALADPLIGRWSDNVRTRWGRRHPFMYASAIPAAIFFFLLWNPPAGLTGGALLAFVLAMLVGARISGSFYEIPSSALVPELTPDFDQRTTLLSWRWFFGIIGGAGATLLLNEVFLGGSNNHLGVLFRQGYAGWAAVVAIVMLAAILASSLGTHKEISRLPAPAVRGPTQRREGLREIKLTLMNRSLVALLLGGLLGGAAGGLTGGLGVYLYVHFWNLDPRQYGFILPMGALGSLLAVFIAPPLSRRLGKKHTMICLFLVSVAMGAGPLFLRLIGLMPPNGSPWITPILALDAAVTSTLGVAGYILAGSMTADVVEDAALRTGMRSEGLLFAVTGLLAKFTGGIGAFLAGVLLTVVRFPEHAIRGTVDPEIMRHLVLLYLPTTVVLNLLAISALGLYRIDRRTHENNLESLRAAAATALDVHGVEGAVGADSASPSLRPL